eukprot:TRINITY_DN4269_c1_g1_i1.p1 TRINITY_DN4269_c1_g1~~TRINITY_DN4269_c1_g1_i1.p1  ORF type:complete len:82 (+),score=11.14 TRINITY_DN4269_c1_g1_i1:49-294(+)
MSSSNNSSVVRPDKDPFSQHFKDIPGMTDEIFKCIVEKLGDEFNSKKAIRDLTPGDLKEECDIQDDELIRRIIRAVKDNYS